MENDRKTAVSPTKNFVPYPAFRVQKEKEEIKILLLSPSDLGFTERMPTLEELFDSARLAAWSKQHLDGATIGMVPGNIVLSLSSCASLHSRALWIAASVEHLLGFNGNVYLFIFSGSDGKELKTVPVQGNKRVSLCTRIAFHLRDTEN